MRILQVCSKPPFPPTDGGSIAMNIITQSLLKANIDIEVISISTSKHFVDEKKIDESYLKKTKFKSVFIDTSIKPLSAFFNLFSSKSYNIQRFYSLSFENALLEKLQTSSFDIIHLETLWVVPYLDVIRKNTKAKIVLRSQNIEYLIWERLANECSNPIKKWYLTLLASRLKKYEYDCLNKFDGIAAITELDVKHYKKMGATIPIIHTPFGIDLEKYKEDKTNTEFPSIFHIGSMDWMPNQDAIKWFIENVWRKLNEQNSKVKLYLAGRNMPNWLKDLKENNVVVEGEVADAQKFINSKSIMIVPLSSGGGMRVKIIEGMALGKTIITTSIGSEGIEYTNNHNILIANSPKEFILALEKCLTDKIFCDMIGNNARKLVEEKYDNTIICKKLTDFYKSII